VAMLKILCFGGVIFDEVENYLHFGGAVNVAVHLSRLGNLSYIITALGNDKPRRKAIDFLKKENVHIEYIHENLSKPIGLPGVVKKCYHFSWICCISEQA